MQAAPASSSGGPQPVYWFLACETDPTRGREGTYAVLKQRLQQAGVTDFSSVLDIPLNLKYGRFDDLIRLGDELNKHELYCENACRRLERMGMDVDAKIEFKIMWQRNMLDTPTYLTRFIWDDAKYPRNRLLTETVDVIMNSVAKLDEEVRVKAGIFGELKQSSQVSQRKENVNLAQKDLVDVFTPDIVSESDFIDTEHFQSLVCVVAKNEEQAFLQKYEKWSEHVVPRSQWKMPAVDRDGTLFYRIVIMRKGLEETKAAAKAQRIVAKEFVYKKDAYNMKAEQRSKMEAEKSKQENILSRICFAAFSECLMAWVHIKAIRVFVEATLRYGVPPQFSAYVIRIPNRSKEPRARKELDQVFMPPAAQAALVKQFYTTAATAAVVGEGATADDDYYSYISAELQPFLVYHDTE